MKELIAKLCARMRHPAFLVRFWDGEELQVGSVQPAFTIHFKSSQWIPYILSNTNVAFGEAYVSGAVEVSGDWTAFFSLLYGSDLRQRGLPFAEKLKVAFMTYRQRNTVRTACRNISHHYDLGNEFFERWLGKEMIYSCAYFITGKESIDTAQHQKMAHLCKKLRLERGMTMLDIGCGWGALARFAAREYGVKVVGITLSEKQRAYAERRIKDEGLQDYVSIRLQDYRLLPATERYDRIVSVGMAEHVGEEFLDEYILATARALEPEGFGILHTIGRVVRAPVNPWIRKYVFPGMYVPTLAELADSMGRAGLHIIDVEAFREQYALTLDHWAEDFEKASQHVEKSHGAEFVRMWRFYLRCCAASFRFGNSCVWQIQYSGTIHQMLPLTRDYMYAEPAHCAKDIATSESFANT